MLTVLPDFREEKWHSMDLCAEMLVKYAPSGFIPEVCIPKFKRVFGFLPLQKAHNFDRWYNRWRVYPSYVDKIRDKTGHFHIVDHSYAHLANHLPRERVGVYCHDLDAFRCLLEPEKENRPKWFRKMMGDVFGGLKRARLIFCSTNAVKSKLIDMGHWALDSIRVVPYGISEEFIPEGPRYSEDYILHVGSCIPRKRIEFLLKVFSEVRKSKKNLKLIQAGGQFTDNQISIIEKLGLEKHIEQVRNLSRQSLASFYRGSRLLLVTSEAEGFGLPVIEGLACGARVIASDISTLREVGGAAVKFCAVGTVDVWVDTVLGVLKNMNDPDKLKRSEMVRKRFDWSLHSKTILESYSSILN